MVMPLADEHPTRRFPWVNYALIAANVIMFVIQQVEPESFTIAFAATPYEITHQEDIDRPIVIGRDLVRQDEAGRARLVNHEQVLPQAPVPIPVWMTVLSAMFLHGGVVHLLGNMLYLWIFGDNVEDVLGHWRYFLVYLACGVAASLAHIAVAPNSLIPSLGASGAIAGVMGMYVLWFPHNQVRVLVFRVIMLMPALVVIGFWIIMQVVLGMGELSRVGQQGGVAYMAHIGGAVAGLAFGVIYMDMARAHGEPPTTFGWGPERYRQEPGPFWANRW